LIAKNHATKLSSHSTTKLEFGYFQRVNITLFSCKIVSISLYIVGYKIGFCVGIFIAAFIADVGLIS